MQNGSKSAGVTSEIVERLERAVPRAEIGDREAHVRPQLVLDRDIALPVVVLQVEASARVVCKTRIAFPDLTERAVVPRSALAVGHGVPEIAVGDEIPVRIGPAHRRARGLIRHGEVHADARVALRIPAQRHLERRLAGAKQVVGGAHPRAEIFPAGRVLDFREIARRHVRARRQVGFRDQHVIHGVPHAQVQRQPPHGPLILRVEPILRSRLIRSVWPRVDRDRHRQLVSEGIRDGLIDEPGVVVALTALAELVQIGTGLEVMCPGDVGHRDPFVRTVVVQ